MIIIVMGVAGSGKTTIGTMLAESLECDYLEGDSLHPPENIEAMIRGVALRDADRAPWLAAIRAHIMEAVRNDRSLVVGCSALKASYRAVLSEGLTITWVYLKGPADLIRSRLQNRVGHFFDPGLLDSQVETLEEPHDAITVDVSIPPAAILDRIMAKISGTPDVRVCAGMDELGARAAEAAAAVIAEAVRNHGRCSLVLSGGDTPRGLHRALASRFRDVIPWQDVHVFWSDERYVPHEDAQSNYRMARETLLDHVPCPAANVHPMPTSFEDPADAAREHEATLRAFFDGERPRFDLAILGLGEDGHTASLFPGAPELHEQARWVLPVFNESAEPRSRLTLTLPLLRQSARTWFLVAGSQKAAAVRDVLTDRSATPTSPAVVLQRAGERVTWWLDRPAAAQLEAAGIPVNAFATLPDQPAADEDDAAH